MAYVNITQVRNLIATWKLVVSEPVIQLACDMGESWIQTVIDKHGISAHSPESLAIYATRKAAFDAAINTLDPYKQVENLPAYISMLKDDLDTFWNLKQGDFERSRITSHRLNRGVNLE